MSHRKIMFGLTLSAAAGFAAAYVPSLVARADNKPAAARPRRRRPASCTARSAAIRPSRRTCRRTAVYKACGESDATFLGEDGSEKDTCKYFFKVPNEKEDDTYVQVYAPTQKEVLPEPNDPFFGYKKVGKVYVTDKAKSPKSAPMLAAQTGLYMPGKGYSVSVNASVKVCTKAEAKKLAPAMK